MFEIRNERHIEELNRFVRHFGMNIDFILEFSNFYENRDIRLRFTLNLCRVRNCD